jgi:hypothetical protein
MPHVLYNHITHSWDRPDPDDGGNLMTAAGTEAPEFGPGARRVLPSLALGSATAIVGLLVLGMVAGLLLGVS